MGYRGSGKSTIGRLLAERLARPLVDLDREIERDSQRSIREIFEQSGEPFFRQLETKVLTRYPRDANQVIALGGGVPIAPVNRTWMKQHGKTVWLTAPPSILWERIQRDEATPDQRPALTDFDGFTEVKRVLAERAGIYEECADYTIDVATLLPEQIASDITQWWQSVDET